MKNMGLPPPTLFVGLHAAMSLMSTGKSERIHAKIRFLVREEVMMLFALSVIFMQRNSS
jgi:hypothetical protein